MTYTEEDAAEGVNGEYYFHYDNFGNTALLTDANGDRQYAAIYDLNNGKMVDEWNPKDLEFVNKGSTRQNLTIISLSNDICFEIANNCQSVLFILKTLFNSVLIHQKVVAAYSNKKIEDKRCKDDWCKTNRGNADSVNIVINGKEVDDSGYIINGEGLAQLKAGGYTDEELKWIGDAAFSCSRNRGGTLNCASQQDIRPGYEDKCCLNCSCSTSPNPDDHTNFSNTLICDDFYSMVPDPIDP
jgi:hypothetical protein